jgi:hypothetical protein
MNFKPENHTSHRAETQRPFDDKLTFAPMPSGAHHVAELLLPPGELTPRTLGVENYVSAEVIADYLGIERRQVLQLTRDDKLPSHPVDSTARRKIWRYKISEVDAAVAGGHRKSPADGALGQSAAQPDNRARQPRHQKAR